MGSASQGKTLLRTYEQECRSTTIELFGFVDITDEVQKVVGEMGLEGGRVTVFSPADRCPLVLNERESGLLKDIRRALARVSLEAGGAPTTIGSNSVVFPLVDGRIRLGRWQRLLLLELEAPMERSFLVQVIGE